MQSEPRVGEPTNTATRAPDGAPDFLVHNEGDHVAVAVQDVPPGRRQAVYMDSDRELELEVSEAIPLGHKVALEDLAADAEAIKKDAEGGGFPGHGIFHRR